MGGNMMPNGTQTTSSPNNSIMSTTQQTLNSVVDETKKDFSSLSDYFTNAYKYLTGSTTTTGGRKSKRRK
jgi:hypothetical protein